MRILVLFLTFNCLLTSVAMSSNTSDFKTVMCFRNSEYDEKPNLYTCNSYFCSKGYKNKYKNHELCKSPHYSDASNHRWFGTGQIYELCTQLMGFSGKGHDKCGVTIN